jgi:hypothetical protein
MPLPAGKYEGSSGMTTLKIQVNEDQTANIVVSSMGMNILSVQNVPCTVTEDNTITLGEAQLQEGLNEMNKSTMVTSFYGYTQPKNVEAKFQPNGRDGSSAPSIWLTVTKDDGNRVLSVTGKLL